MRGSEVAGKFTVLEIAGKNPESRFVQHAGWSTYRSYFSYYRFPVLNDRMHIQGFKVFFFDSDEQCSKEK